MLDDGFIRLRERKGGSQTVVPVDEEVKHAIKRYRLVRPDNDSEYLFLSIQGMVLVCYWLTPGENKGSLFIGWILLVCAKVHYIIFLQL